MNAVFSGVNMVDPGTCDVYPATITLDSAQI